MDVIPENFGMSSPINYENDISRSEPFCEGPLGDAPTWQNHACLYKPTTDAGSLPAGTKDYCHLLLI